MRKTTQSGFSLIELMVSVLILMVVMGAVFQQIDNVQKRARSEETKQDMFQTAREFMDQMVRDVHQAGFPNAKLYDDLGTPPLYPEYEANQNNATGVIYMDWSQLRLEGDVDGDGTVDVVSYALFPQTAAAGDQNCPCLRRSQQQKLAGFTDPLQQVPVWVTQVENLAPIVDANGNAQIFFPYDRRGQLVDLNVTGRPLVRRNFSPKDDGFTGAAADPINRIWTVQIRLNVQAQTGDIGTGQRPVAYLTATAQVNN